MERQTTDLEQKIARKRLNALLTPSWLSGLVAIVAGLVVTIGVFVLFGAQSIQIQQELVSLQNTSAQPALTIPGQAPPNADVTNSLQNTWPLLAFWGVIGLIVYFVVESGVRALNNLADLKNELNYVHAQRQDLVRATVEQLLLKVAAAVAWLIFMEIFFKRIIPYSITAAYASASAPQTIGGLLYALLSFVMITLSVHIHVIFLRLVLRRPRVFSQGDYL